MQWWALMLLLVAIKVPIAVLMLWIPLRSDDTMSARVQDSSQEPGTDDDGGGSKTLPQEPRDPHPRRPVPIGPRRGSHGSPEPPSPPRIRQGHRERVTVRPARR